MASLIDGILCRLQKIQSVRDAVAGSLFFMLPTKYL